MNRKFIFSLFSGSLSLLCLASSVRAETVLAKIEHTGVLRVAIREDSAPLGYLDANDDLKGYCLDFFALLKEQLKDNLERDTLSIKLFKSTPANRFDLVENNTVDLECGPNTIRSNIPPNTIFSQGFLSTGTQFLVKNKNSLLFDLSLTLKDLPIGVIGNTTTEQIISDRYPSAVIQRYSGVTGRIRGVQAVVQDKIIAMGGDGILLQAEAQRQGLSSTEYSLIPNTPLTCDQYGMIIRSNDSQWQDFINSVINSPQAVNLADIWFGDLFDVSTNSLDSCKSN